MRSRYVWIVRGFVGNVIAAFTVKKDLKRYLADKGRDIDIIRVDCLYQKVVPLNRDTLEPAEK